MLGDELQKRTLHATLVIFGSVPNALAGQPERTTLDIDIWKPKSIFYGNALKVAAEAIGLLYDPKDDLEPDKPYLQIVNPGIVQLGEFEPMPLGLFGNLTICQAPISNVIASKLCRATETDIEDIAWLMGQHQIDKGSIKAIISTFPQYQQETATENLVFLDTITFSQNQKTFKR